jgi:hypothetical protein
VGLDSPTCRRIAQPGFGTETALLLVQGPLQGTLTAATHSASKHYQFYLQQPGNSLVPAREPTGGSVRPAMMFIKQGGAGGDGGGAGFAPGRPPPQLATQQHARATPSQLARRPPQQQEHLMDAYAHNRLTGSSPVPSFSPTHFRPPPPP